MKLRIYRVITGGLLLLCMVMIFRFSAQPASESEQVSGGVACRIVETWSHLTGTEYTQSEMEAYADRIDYPVRKLAHMTEYGILCLLACAFVHGYSGNWKVCEFRRLRLRRFTRRPMRSTSCLSRGAPDGSRTCVLIRWER